MYEVIDGKEHVAINGCVLGKASQKELKHLHSMNHPYIVKKQKERKKKENDEK
jgi:hypothetical protein